ncbi:MAG: pilus (MSHA type) biogenesis protein MshL [Magnetococcales bacterium]|nr:pilus (MSHA type) biogenesis protein MshL [Magnetococcales bacterium]
MSGCQSVQTKTNDPEKSRSEVVPTGAKSGSAPNLPKDVKDLLLSDATSHPSQESLEASAQKIEISVESAPARVFFPKLVERSPYNVVVGADVTAEISLNLKNVTLQDVFQIVCDEYNLYCSRQGNVYRVSAGKRISKIFNIEYLQIERSGNTSTQIITGQIEVGSSTKNTQNLNGQGSEKTIQVINNGSAINTTSSTHFWRVLENTIRTMIALPEREYRSPDALNQMQSQDHGQNQNQSQSQSKGQDPSHMLLEVNDVDGPSVALDSQAGLLIVKAYPKQLKEVGKYLKNMEENILRQVVIEARILEVNLNDGFQSGVDWASLIHLPPDGDRSTVLKQSGGGSIFGRSGIPLATNNVNYGKKAYDSLITRPTSFGGTFAMAMNLGNFEAFIQLIKTQGEVNVLSSPRVSTLNNQKAIIRVGSDEIFMRGVSVTSKDASATGSASSVMNPQLTSYFSGISLDVTPKISKNGHVSLHIHPAISNVTDKDKTFTLGSASNGTFTLPLALNEIRETDSVVRAKNGEIIVIGGLMQTKIQNEQAGLPVLGDLPIVGGFFSHQFKSRVKSELVILLRPVIINNPNDWDQVKGSNALQKEALGDWNNL